MEVYVFTYLIVLIFFEICFLAIRVLIFDLVKDFRSLFFLREVNEIHILAVSQRAERKSFLQSEDCRKNIY